MDRIRGLFNRIKNISLNTFLRIMLLIIIVATIINALIVPNRMVDRCLAEFPEYTRGQCQVITGN